MIDKELWLKFLWSFTLSNHMGDACEAIRGLAKKANLPMPGEYAELNTKSTDPDESWLAWIKSQGINEGIWS